MTVSRKVSDPAFRNPQLPLEERVSSLLSELTREEKLSLCAGRNFWETKAVPRLELRPFRMSDGPRGVAFHSARRRGTSFPSGIALGASWDPRLAERVGQALGAETRAAGCQMILGPAVNICRTPLGGRTFEYFTEDPQPPLWAGSSGVWPPEEVTPLRGLRETLGSWGSLVASPAEADVAILFLGQSHRPGMDSEMRDRSRLELPAKQVRLIRETVRANPRTIVVLIAGSPIAMEWAHSVPAILMAWYPGMEGGRAIANALLGKVNPSGKLPVTFPRKLDDSPAHRNHETFPGNEHEVRYDELTLSAASWEGEGSLDVSFTLTNRGPRAGAEVIQLYVGNREARTPRPLRELKAFRKILLEAGQCQRVEIELTTRDFAVYSEPAGSWLAEAGEFSVAVGSSSRDIRLEAPVALLKDQLLSR